MSSPVPPGAPGAAVSEDALHKAEAFVEAEEGAANKLGGWLGVFVPGLPTTIFLIIASYCFARSCPWLEDRLLRIPLFAPYMKVLDEGRGMSRKAAASALLSMWSCVGLSCAILFAAGRLRPWVAAIIVLSAVAGTGMILLYARKPRLARA